MCEKSFGDIADDLGWPEVVKRRQTGSGIAWIDLSSSVEVNGDGTIRKGMGEFRRKSAFRLSLSCTVSEISATEVWLRNAQKVELRKRSNCQKVVLYGESQPLSLYPNTNCVSM